MSLHKIQNTKCMAYAVFLNIRKLYAVHHIAEEMVITFLYIFRYTLDILLADAMTMCIFKRTIKHSFCLCKCLCVVTQHHSRQGSGVLGCTSFARLFSILRTYTCISVGFTPNGFGCYVCEQKHNNKNNLKKGKERRTGIAFRFS